MRFLADENFHYDIVRGVRRHVPNVEITRIQDTELYSKPDPQVLAWAAEKGYILLTHDVNTMPAFFYTLKGHKLRLFKGLKPHFVPTLSIPTHQGQSTCARASNCSQRQTHWTNY